jgi:hypothetical protein
VLLNDIYNLWQTPFLARIEMILVQKARAKTEEDLKIQEKIQNLGLCPIGIPT